MTPHTVDPTANQIACSNRICKVSSNSPVSRFVLIPLFTIKQSAHRLFHLSHPFTFCGGSPVVVPVKMKKSFASKKRSIPVTTTIAESENDSQAVGQVGFGLKQPTNSAFEFVRPFIPKPAPVGMLNPGGSNFFTQQESIDVLGHNLFEGNYFESELRKVKENFFVNKESGI